MNEDLVSIIIPTYNRAHLIGETLDSVIAQTYQSWECIVVDDGSADYTEELMEFYRGKDSRILYHHRPQDRPKGANACRNYGFELSSGAYIQWFDDDDILLSKFLSLKVKSFKKEVIAVICCGYYVSEDLKKETRIEVDVSKDLFKSYIKWEAQIITDSVLFRKSFLQNKELFKFWLSRGQEEELFSRIFFQLKRDSYTVIPTPLFLYRQHSMAKSFQNKEYIFLNKKSEAYVYLENFKRSLILKDQEILKILWKRLINLYFLGLDNHDFENSKKIIRGLASSIFSFNKKMSIELFSIGNLLCFIRRDSHKIRKRWKSLSFSIK